MLLSSSIFCIPSPCAFHRSLPSTFPLCFQRYTPLKNDFLCIRLSSSRRFSSLLPGGHCILPFSGTRVRTTGPWLEVRTVHCIILFWAMFIGGVIDSLLGPRLLSAMVWCSVAGTGVRVLPACLQLCTYANPFDSFRTAVAPQAPRILDVDVPYGLNIAGCPSAHHLVNLLSYW